MNGLRFDSFREIGQYLMSTRPPGESVAVDLSPRFDPLANGFVADAGFPPGPRGDWRMALSGGRCLHLQRQQDFSWILHWDAIDPTPSIAARAKHGLKESPKATALVFGLIGGVAGALLDGKRGAKSGALLGVAAAGVGHLALSE